MRAVRKEHGAGGRAGAGRAAPVFELVLRARLWVRRVRVAPRARAVWVRSGRGAEFEEVRGRAGRLAVAVRGASPGVGSGDGLDEDWPRADAPRATEAAREQSRGRRRELLSNHLFLQVFRVLGASDGQGQDKNWCVARAGPAGSRRWAGDGASGVGQYRYDTFSCTEE